MEDKGKRIAESLRLCAKVPIKCDGCIEAFGVGCATRLRNQAADIIEEMAGELEEARRNDSKMKTLSHLEGSTEGTQKRS